MAAGDARSGLVIARHATAVNIAVGSTLLLIAGGAAAVLHLHGLDPFLAVAAFLLPTPVVALLFPPLIALPLSLLPPGLLVAAAGVDLLARPSVVVGLLLIPAVTYVIGEMFRLGDRLKDAQDAFEQADEVRTKLQGQARRESAAQQGIEARLVSLSSRILHLKGIARSLGAALDLGKLLADLMTACEKALKATRACLLVADGTGGLVPKATLGWSAKDAAIERVEIDAEIAGRALEARGVLLARDILAHPKHKDMYDRSKVKFLMGAPVGAEGEPIGVLLVERTKSPTVDDDDVQVLSILADLATLSLRNAALYTQMERMANTDGLTKLYTKRYFGDFMKVELQRSRRYGRKVSLLLSDIDHFKDFNDAHGHQAGDEVLRETATVFVRTVRGVDLVARYGGEEFVTVLPETDEKGALIIAERIRANVEARRIEFEGKTLAVTCSIGVATYPTDGEDAERLVKLADEALYVAKKGGRNCVVRAGAAAPEGKGAEA